ncbi:DsrE family protein [Thermoproteus tenax]|uniref:Uncharacterized protein n=1 Tax=Thermoproteus tenax (strain ATCC 35583 / DSM 2078 / JCM 9277 / NBRC 100435 / Kra 1) TaxID=768679 RepID=G4RNF8_THETK|nr:DsrE family protein [Thermoproteus tenax]CCC81102.1 conserved hypothetical protein [Thermoproteus tenax Kra 1]
MEKLLLHVDSDDPVPLSIALSNAENFLAAVGNADIAVVANGLAVKHMVKGSPFRERIAALARRGVKFYVCNNSLRNLGIDPRDVHENAEIVPAGIVKIVELVKQGYIYVKP